MIIDQCKWPTLQHMSCPATNASTVRTLRVGDDLRRCSREGRPVRGRGGRRHLPRGHVDVGRRNLAIAGDTDSDTNSHAYSHSHCDTNTYTYCEPDTSAYSDTKAAPNAASSPDPVKISSRRRSNLPRTAIKIEKIPLPKCRTIQHNSRRCARASQSRCLIHRKPRLPHPVSGCCV